MFFFGRWIRISLFMGSCFMSLFMLCQVRHPPQDYSICEIDAEQYKNFRDVLAWPKEMVQFKFHSFLEGSNSWNMASLKSNNWVGSRKITRPFVQMVAGKAKEEEEKIKEDIEKQKNALKLHEKDYMTQDEVQAMRQRSVLWSHAIDVSSEPRFMEDLEALRMDLEGGGKKTLREKTKSFSWNLLHWMAMLSCSSMVEAVIEIDNLLPKGDSLTNQKTKLFVWRAQDNAEVAFENITPYHLAVMGMNPSAMHGLMKSIHKDLTIPMKIRKPDENGEPAPAEEFTVDQYLQQMYSLTPKGDVQDKLKDMLNMISRGTT